MAALDAQPVDSTMRLRVNAYSDADEAARQKRLADAESLRIAQEQNERAAAASKIAQAEEARKVTAEGQAKLPGVMASDFVQWGAPDVRGKSFAEVPQYVRDHAISAYADAGDKVPEAWNKAQSDLTGKIVGAPSIPGLDGMEPVGATVNPKGEASIQMKPKAAAEPQFDDFTTPQDVQAAMPEAEASLAEQLGNYKVSMQALSRFPATTKMRIMRAAKVFNPDFDVKEFNNLNKARQAYSIGAQGQNIASINTVIGHLGQLSRWAKELHNKKIPIIGETYNSVKNDLARRSGESAITNFEQSKEAVASELAKVFKGAGATSEAQMREWRKGINSDMSPEQLRDAIANAVHLMGSRVQEIDRQWDQLTKAPRDYRVLSEPNKRILAEIGFDPSELDPTGQSQPGAPAADSVLPPAANAPAKLLPADQAAIDWANANPTDPRAARIKAVHGIK